MKPKTKIQFEVWDLHQKLPNPKHHEAFVISNHKHYFTTHYKQLVCLECNHKWKPEQTWHSEVVGADCPSCGKKLKKQNTENGGKATRIIIYLVTEVVDRFQVFRYFSCWKHMSKDKSPDYTFHALFEQWVDYDKNKNVIVGRTTSNYGDGFTSSDYEIRGYSVPFWKGSVYEQFTTDINCPGAEFLPRFQKYGLTSFKHDFDHRQLIERMERSSQIETMFKAKQFKLLKFALYRDSRYSQYWQQIKLVIRHKYIIKDVGIWYDYLDLLRYFRKDINNPKYICPSNLHKEHDRYMKKKRVILNQQERERERQQAIKRQQDLEQTIKDYADHFSRFFDLEIKEGNLTVRALRSVEEFKEEGDEMRHCVYTNEYYLKKDSLIMSARVDGVRTETVEINLKKFTIEQCRGQGPLQEPTPHHDRIVELIKKNISKIKEVVRKTKKTKTNLTVNNQTAAA